jgi:hypothetical protein
LGERWDGRGERLGRGSYGGGMTLRVWAGAGIVAGSLFLATPAWSQTYTGVTPPTVAADTVSRQVPPTTVAALGDLAVTGADILELVAIGALGVSAGAVGMRMSRARPKPSLA